MNAWRNGDMNAWRNGDMNAWRNGDSHLAYRYYNQRVAVSPYGPMAHYSNQSN